MFVGSEVPNVVANYHQQPPFDTLGVKAGEQRHKLDELIGLQQQMIIVRGISHGDGKLDLPMSGAGLDYSVHQLRQVWHCLRTDLRVDADPQPGSLGAPQSIQRTGEGAGHAADAVMQRFHAIQRDSDSLQSRVHSSRETLGSEVSAAGLDGAIHSVGPYGANDLGPVRAQVSLATDQRDLAG